MKYLCKGNAFTYPKKKLLCENCRTQPSKALWFDTGRDVQLEHFIVLTVPFQLLNTLAGWSQVSFCEKAEFTPTKENSQVSTLSPVFCLLLFPAITQTESAQPTKCIGDKKFGCNTVSWTDSISRKKLEQVFLCGLWDGEWLKRVFFFPWIFWMHTLWSVNQTQCFSCKDKNLWRPKKSW